LSTINVSEQMPILAHCKSMRAMITHKTARFFECFDCFHRTTFFWAIPKKIPHTESSSEYIDVILRSQNEISAEQGVNPENSSQTDRIPHDSWIFVLKITSSSRSAISMRVIFEKKFPCVQ
jgi:hypothetical protein